MDPESIKNTPAYLVLAYAIKWDTGVVYPNDAPPPNYVLLDMRSWKSPTHFTADEFKDLVAEILKDCHDCGVRDCKIKIVEGEEGYLSE